MAAEEEAIDLAAVLHSNRSAAHASLLHYYEALADATKAVELSPRWPKAYCRLGVAHAGLGNLDDAISACNKGLEVDPGNEALKSRLSHVLNLKQSAANSRERLAAKIRADPDVIRKEKDAGNSAFKKKDFDTAIEHYTRALELVGVRSVAAAPAPSPGDHTVPVATASTSMQRGPSSLNTTAQNPTAQNRRVEEVETPIIENEIRVTTHGRMQNYVNYAANLLQENSANAVVFKALGKAIDNAVMSVEELKRRIRGLHQNTTIGSIELTNAYYTLEPQWEGLLPLDLKRRMPMITITLSRKKLDTSSIGYQSPLPTDQVSQWPNFDNEREGSPSGTGRGFRGRGRGASGNGNMASDCSGGVYDIRSRRNSEAGLAHGLGYDFLCPEIGGYGGQAAYQYKAGRRQEKDAVEDRVVLEKNSFKDDKDDDCVILEGSPYEETNTRTDLFQKPCLDGDPQQIQDQDDLSIIAERGQVACRDYPHSRHLCAKYPFNKTPHEKYCSQCYCYVCDKAAPCKYWKESLLAHCDASDQDAVWRVRREANRPSPRREEPVPWPNIPDPPWLLFH